MSIYVEEQHLTWPEYNELHIDILLPGKRHGGIERAAMEGIQCQLVLYAIHIEHDAIALLLRFGAMLPLEMVHKPELVFTNIQDPLVLPGPIMMHISEGTGLVQ